MVSRFKLAAMRIAASSLVAASLATASFANAQAGPSAPVRARVDAAVQARTELQAVREENRDEMRVRIASTTEAIQKAVQERKDDLAKRVSAMKAKIASTTVERKVRLEEQTRKRVENLTSAILARFKHTSSQMDNISARLHARIEQLKEQGAATASSVAALEAADAKLAQAKSDITMIEASIKAELASATSKESLNAQIKTAKQSLENAWNAYKETVKTVRIEVGGALKADELEVHASSTDSGTI